MIYFFGNKKDEQEVKNVNKLSIKLNQVDPTYSVSLGYSAVGQISRSNGEWVYTPFFNSWGAGIDLTAAGMRKILSKLDELNGVDSE